MTFLSDYNECTIVVRGVSTDRLDLRPCGWNVFRQSTLQFSVGLQIWDEAGY